MTNLDEAFVMIKSRIWPESWVGKEICWLRLKLSNNLLKTTVFGSSFLSKWMLTSSTKIKSTFELSTDKHGALHMEMFEYSMSATAYSEAVFTSVCNDFWLQQHFFQFQLR